MSGSPMTHSNARYFQRLALNVQNALSAARVLRGTNHLFDGHPLMAAGAGVLVGALIGRLGPDVVQRHGWAQEIFTRLSPEYGHLVACDLPDLVGMLQSERHSDRAVASIRRVDMWTAHVASGNAEADFLLDVAEEIGKLLLSLMLIDSPLEVSSADVGKRAVDIYERGMRLAGGSFDEACKKDSLHVRKAAFAELAIVTSTAALHVQGRIPFQQIGAAEQLLIRLSPTNSAGYHLAAWISAKGLQPRLVSPITALSTLRSGFGITTDSDDAIQYLRRLDRYCAGLVKGLSEAA